MYERVTRYSSKDLSPSAVVRSLKDAMIACKCRQRRTNTFQDRGRCKRDVQQSRHRYDHCQSDDAAKVSPGLFDALLASLRGGIRK